MPPVDYEVIGQLVLATCLGAVVGLEREAHGRPAGTRTNALVCLASALLIIVSRTGALVGMEGQGNVNLNVDPSRMAAGIVTGIGFLGAGAILRIRESIVRGLTTAASVWFVAALGIAVGIGEYTIALASTCLALIILMVLHRVDRRLHRVSYRTVTIRGDARRRDALERSCRELFAVDKALLQSVAYSIDTASSHLVLTFSIRVDTRANNAATVDKLIAIDGVASVNWS